MRRRRRAAPAWWRGARRAPLPRATRASSWEARIEPTGGGERGQIAASAARASAARPPASGCSPTTVRATPRSRSGSPRRSAGPSSSSASRCGPLVAPAQPLARRVARRHRPRRSSPLEPPWPDLVIAAGRRTAPVARWIARAVARAHAASSRSAARAATAPTASTSASRRATAGCFPHPRRIETAAPLHRVTRGAARRGARSAGAPASARCRAAHRAAGRRHLGTVPARRGATPAPRARRHAHGRAAGGSRARDHEPAARRGRDATRCAARWRAPRSRTGGRADAGDNPYLGFLAWPTRS